MNRDVKKSEIDLMEYVGVVLKRKWVLAAFAGSLVLFTGIFSFLATPIYKATATLLIEEENSKILSIDETFGFQSRAPQDYRYFNTQMKLLKSKSLAENVARKMNLLSRPEFNPKAIPSGTLPPTQRTQGQPLSNSYSESAERLRLGIDVKPVRETRLVEVSFASPSPILASEIVNTLAEEFITFSVEKRFQTTQQASDFLGEQIANLRDELASKEREIQRYGQDKQILFLSESENTEVNKFANIYQAYNQALIDRVRAEASYREIKNLDVDSIPQVINNPVAQQLRSDYTRTKNEYDEKSKIFKPDYPEMIQLKARLDSMKNELRKAVAAAETEFQSAIRREESLKSLLEKQRLDVNKMNSNAILYNSLKVEVDTRRKLLNSLVERQNETVVSSKLGELKTSNINIIDRAEIPKKPVLPRKKLNLLLALLLGLSGGVGLCFLLEYLDNTVKGPEEVEKMTGLPSLGVVPFFSPEETNAKKGDSYSIEYGDDRPEGQKLKEADETPPSGTKKIELINHYHPKLSISEHYRTVRTSFLLSHASMPPRTIVFTSSLPQEGKTSTIVNIAVAFAQLQERVLLIECDLRKPRFHQIFNLTRTKGMSSYLTGRVSLKEAIQKTALENIWVLPCGPTPPNPAELLNSTKMKDMMAEVREVFDIVLIDTPPVLVVIDPIIVSSLADAVVLVVRAGKTARKPFLNAVAELKKSDAKIIGVIFNGVRTGTQGYYYGGYHHAYGSIYQSQDGEEHFETEASDS
jgi:capsular exopolysaccharide synthesis family protein